MSKKKLSALELQMKKMAKLCTETFANENKLPSLAEESEVRAIVSNYNSN